MWRPVSALTLVSVALVAALPAAQQNGGLDSLIDSVFNSPTISTSPQSVPQIGGDLDSLIREVFNTDNNTISSRNVTLGSQNTPPPKPDNCECVPYYQCKNGTIEDKGIGIIDIRSGFDDDNNAAQGWVHWPKSLSVLDRMACCRISVLHTNVGSNVYRLAPCSCVTRSRFEIFWGFNNNRWLWLIQLY